MSTSNIIDPQDEMIRARDVNRVAMGEQASRPAHEPAGSISQAATHHLDHLDHMTSTPLIKVDEITMMRTAPADVRFSTTNQTRHCCTRYIEYHKCVKAKGEIAVECEKFARYYRSLCPSEWVEY